MIKNRETYLSNKDESFEFEAFMQSIATEYDSDNDIIELIRGIKKEMDDLKLFMAPRLAKDKKMFEVKVV